MEIIWVERALVSQNGKLRIKNNYEKNKKWAPQ